MKKAKISNNVIRRLPRYLRKLDELKLSGVTRISSSEFGKLLGLTPSQIRQDFSCFGEFGQQGYGYNIQSLRAEIASILGIDRLFPTVLVGVGNIGRALMENFDFENCGCKLKCAFDLNPELIGTEINGLPVHDIRELTDYLDNNDVELAVLCVPRNAAHATADILISHGIEAIWNFTNVDLTEPGSPILVESLHFSDSLLSLDYYVNEHKKSKAAN